MMRFKALGVGPGEVVERKIHTVDGRNPAGGAGFLPSTAWFLLNNVEQNIEKDRIEVPEVQ